MNVAVGTKPDWSQWEGDVVGGEFPLGQLIGSSDRSAVFRTRLASGDGAIKLVPAGTMQAKDLVEQWNRTALLDHPHLLKIVKAGRWAKAGVPLAYLVMEYADENLGTVLLERPLTPAEAFEMLPPIADALAFLHDHGLVHGRLDPSNIFAVQDTLKISSGAVSSGDASADLRALAAATVHVLTQQSTTFTGSTSETSLIAGLPPNLQEIVRNCAGENGRKQWSAAELAGWLRRQPSPSTNAFAANSPGIAPARIAEESKPSTPQRPVSRSGNRTPNLTRYAIVIALLALVVVTVGSLVSRRTAGAPSGATPSSTKPVEHTPAEQTPSADPVATPVKAPARTAKAAKPSATPDETATRPSASPAEIVDARDAALRENVVRQVLPEISTKARHSVHGTAKILVRVAVDPSGNVTDATLESTGSPYFGKLAVEAARKWQFVAADAASQAWVLRFDITRDDTKVFLSKAAGC